MRGVRLFLLALIGALATGGNASLAADDATARLLEELRQLAQQSREQRAADRWLQRALDDLVARYDRPWQRAILFEDFGDGDYTRNPSWKVLGGHFQVVRGQGLSSVVGAYVTAPGTQAPEQASPEDELSSLIVGALLDRALGPSGSPADRPASAPRSYADSQPNRIRLRADVSNAFAMTLTLRTGGSSGARFDVALAQSEQEKYGYRLILDTGPRGFVELQRIRGGRGAVVESRPLQAAINDGRLHDISWQQAPDGMVRVLLDEQALFEVRDRAFRDDYPWLTLNHQAGELTLRSLRIDGT